MFVYSVEGDESTSGSTSTVSESTVSVGVTSEDEDELVKSTALTDKIGTENEDDRFGLVDKTALGE